MRGDELAGWADGRGSWQAGSQAGTDMHVSVQAASLV